MLKSRSEHYEEKKSVDPAANGTADLPVLSLVTTEY
jgi:hypothetical protein